MDITENSGKENELEAILFQTIQEKLNKKRSDGSGFQETILHVFQEMLEFADSIVRDLEENGQSPAIACRTGCTYCCHSQVSIIPIEALVIWAFIKRHFTGTQICDLTAGISRMRALTAGKTIEQIYAIKKDLPCLFLKKGRCSIYETRPSICRSWNSFASQACRTAYDSVDSASSVGASPARNFVYGTTQALFARLSDAFSLQSATLLLPNAVSDCLNSADTMERWAGGDDVFRYGG